MNINISHTFYPAWISLEAFITGGSSKTEISALLFFFFAFFAFLMCAFTYLSKFILTLGLSIMWGIRVTNVPQPDFYIQKTFAGAKKSDVADVYRVYFFPFPCMEPRQQKHCTICRNLDMFESFLHLLCV